MQTDWHMPLLLWLVNKLTVLQEKLLPAEIILVLVYMIVKFVIGGVLEPRLLRLVKHKSKQQIFHLFIKIAKLAVITMGIISALGTIGVDVTSLVAVTGLFSFSVGFAMQDVLSNVLSGVMILMHHPFKVGDCIKILTYEGEVIAIDLRYTHVRTDDDVALIPNKTLFQSPVVVCAEKQGKAST